MAVKKKRKKSGKFTPLIWIVTGALIAFFISYSGNLAKINILQKSKNSPSDSTNISPLDFLFKSKKSASLILTNQNTNTEKEEQLSAIPSAVKIFLASQNGNEINLVEKTVNITKGPAQLKDTLESLINYREDPLLNLVPLNTKIRKVWIKNDVAYIDFSEDFSYNSYGIIGYKIQIYQVVYTATQFPQVKAVYFYMEGKPVEYLGGDGYIIHNPIYPYSSLPKFSMQ